MLPLASMVRLGSECEVTRGEPQGYAGSRRGRKGQSERVYLGQINDRTNQNKAWKCQTNDIKEPG